MSVKPITDTLRLLDGGAFLDLASDKLAELVKGVDETGKAGALVLKLDVKRVSGGALSITPHVTTKVPEPKPEGTLLWATVEGNLSQQNPKQQSLDLREVNTQRGELKTAAA